MTNLSQTSDPIREPKASVRDFWQWMLRLSYTNWILVASGYDMASFSATRAN